MGTWRGRLWAALLGATLGGMVATGPPVEAATGWVIRPSSNAPNGVPVHLGVIPHQGVQLIVPVGGPGAVKHEWTIHRASRAGEYRLYSRATTNGCLSMRRGYTDFDRRDGNPISLLRCPSLNTYEEWRFFIGWPPRAVSPYSAYLNSNLAMIQSVGTGKCVGIAPAAQFTAGTLVQQYTCTPDMKRRWRVRSFQIPD